MLNGNRGKLVESPDRAGGEGGDGGEGTEAADGAAVELFVRSEDGSYEVADAVTLAELGWERAEERTTKDCDYCAEQIPAKAVRCRYCGSTCTKRSTESGDGFDVLREQVALEVRGVKRVQTHTVLAFTNDQLANIVRSYAGELPSLYDKVPKVGAEDLFSALPNLRRDYGGANNFGGMTEEIRCLHKLIEFLSSEFAEQEEKFTTLRSEGLISFDMLRFMFTRGDKICGTVDRKHMVGTSVSKTEYVKTQCGSLFVVSGEVIKSTGDGFFSAEHSFVVPAFHGVQEASSLPVRLMGAEEEEALKQRGTWFEKIGIGAHFLSYSGPMMFKTPDFTSQWNADGRVMIDCSSFQMHNPGYRTFECSDQRNSMFGRSSSSAKGLVQRIDPEQLYKCWHSIGGFSFRTKKWGEVFVDGASEISFDDQAYDTLVLPMHKKNLIRALVQNSSSAFSDVIKGKGNGCIFLLHGPPGTGKTLTAEAVAELLHIPLYSITCGELGVSTESLESSLRQLLDVASKWGSAVLIDEADIFLEQRQDNDIQRNAMVGIFLRLLEYHQGIMFLTTNRVKRFDEAFHSRISVALRYPALDLESRSKVWQNLLRIACVVKEPTKGGEGGEGGEADSGTEMVCSDLDVAALAEHDLNGRQIRTTIRLAQAIAAHSQEPLKMRHFEQNIRVSEQFSSDLRSSYD